MKRMRLRGERGAAAVEFAMIAVVFLMIVFGIIEFGILMFDQHVLTNASREGARAGIVMRAPRLPDEFTPSEKTECIEDCEASPHPVEIEYCIKRCEGIKDIVLRYAEEHMVSFGASSVLETSVMWNGATTMPSTLNFGDELAVTVTYPFDFLVLSGFGLGPITLTAETRMRME